MKFYQVKREADNKKLDKSGLYRGLRLSACDI
nr:MAG TPA: hypothetical protein [Bacteriophage sp.]